MSFHRIALAAAALGVLAALAAARPEPRASPPRIVRAVPDNGDTDVDPALTEIRVEFDQDMDPGGYSWCGGGESFPKTRGRARWDTPRICILPVTLEPNHHYALSINCPSARNFRSAAGAPAETYPLSFRTGPARPAGVGETTRPAARHDHAAAADALHRAVRERYAYRDLRKVDWEKEFAAARPRLAAAETPAAFAREAARLLARAEDIHITLECDGMTFATHRRFVPPNCNPQRLPRLVPGFTRHNDCVASGRFPDGIGYLQINSWSRECAEPLAAAYAALEDFADTRGLILDVRCNAGGDETLAQQLAGCFIDRPAVYGRHVYVDPAAPGGFREAPPRSIAPTPGRPRYRGRVAVLTGRHVMSSCESFLLMMKQVPRCQLLGATSYGASGNPRPHALPNGVTVWLPSWKDMTADGQELEGRGIPPDVAVLARPEDFAERDPVLEAALRVLRE